MKVFIFSNFMWRYEHVNFDVQKITVGKQYVSIPYEWCILSEQNVYRSYGDTCNKIK